MQQSLSELLADTHKQESGHQFAYPEMSVWVCTPKQMTLAIYEPLSDKWRNCNNLAAKQAQGFGMNNIAIGAVFAFEFLLLFAKL